MTREITYAEAICEAQKIALRNDPDVILFGENVAAPWRPATKGLKDMFGKERVRDAPITETAFIGAGVGAAIAGAKPIVELMLVDFSLVAMDQILNQMAKTTYMTGGNVNVPWFYELSMVPAAVEQPHTASVSTACMLICRG